MKLEENADLSPLTLGDSTITKKGDHVYAIGSPLGLSNTISDGILSGRLVQEDMGGMEMLQISAPISSGSSGGALINDNYEVIGITFAGFSEGENLNLAIPIEEAVALKESGMSELTMEDFYALNHEEHDYMQAMDDFNAENYEEAEKLFIKLSETNYKDSKEWLNETRYEKAWQKANQNNISVGFNIMKKLADNGYTKAIIDLPVFKEALYQYALAKFETNDLIYMKSAVSEFNKIADYKDSATFASKYEEAYKEYNYCIVNRIKGNYTNGN